jgi:DNA-binding response OmpR family regulator
MQQEPQNNIVLCIEDDPDIRTFCLRTLELEGYVCLHTEKPTEAIKLARNRNLNLVLLDLRLFEDDGWSILKKLKDDPKTAGIPVIVFTASYAISQKERALSMGAIEYLVKPLSAKTLKNAISRVLPLN